MKGPARRKGVTEQSSTHARIKGSSLEFFEGPVALERLGDGKCTFVADVVEAEAEISESRPENAQRRTCQEVFQRPIYQRTLGISAPCCS